MFTNDILFSFAVMAVLFLRQIAILKQANKINYAPLMLGIGGISSIVHFIIYPESQNFTLLLRESFFPLLVALLLFMVMNIMHQTQEKEEDRVHDAFALLIAEQMAELKSFMSELEVRVIRSQQEDREAYEEIRQKFKEDIQALSTIENNQVQFLDKFAMMDGWHEKVSKEFDAFRDVEMPKLNSIIHEHIDIFRVSEQDHYNKITNILSKAGASRDEIAQDMDSLKSSVKSLVNVAERVAQSITKHTLQQLSGVTQAFKQDITGLKSHSQGIETSLLESESSLLGIREKSEFIMKQMLLSANTMSEIEEKNTALYDVYGSMKDLVQEIEVVKADYVTSQAQLGAIASTLKSSQEEQIDKMTERIENLSKELSEKMEDSLHKLHAHYHIAEEEVSQSVQILAKKAQLQKGYTELDS